MFICLAAAERRVASLVEVVGEAGPGCADKPVKSFSNSLISRFKNQSGNHINQNEIVN